MRAETLVRVAAHHAVKPLVIRGGLARAFGSLASFLAALFLSSVSSCSETPSNIHWPRKPRQSSQRRSASSWRPSCFSFLSPGTASAPELHASGARDGRKVSLLENLSVVELVSRGDERQRPHAYLVLIGYSAAHPHVCPERTKQRKARASHIR
jgi:hypothetical protein